MPLRPFAEMMPSSAGRRVHGGRVPVAATMRISSWGAAARPAGRAQQHGEVASRGGQHGNQYAKVSKENFGSAALPTALLPKGLIRPVSAIGKRYVMTAGMWFQYQTIAVEMNDAA